MPLDEDKNKPIRERCDFFDMHPGGGPDLRARTSNGNITVKLPESAGARVRARTSNSSVASDFPLNNVTAMGKTHMDGTVGAGGPLLYLVTSNGHIRLVRE